MFITVHIEPNTLIHTYYIFIWGLCLYRYVFVYHIISSFRVKMLEGEDLNDNIFK